MHYIAGSMHSETSRYVLIKIMLVSDRCCWLLIRITYRVGLVGTLNAQWWQATFSAHLLMFTPVVLTLNFLIMTMNLLSPR